VTSRFMRSIIISLCFHFLFSRIWIPIAVYLKAQYTEFERYWNRPFFCSYFTTGDTIIRIIIRFRNEVSETLTFILRSIVDVQTEADRGNDCPLTERAGRSKSGPKLNENRLPRPFRIVRFLDQGA
jgi:hypothetical protein